MSSYIYCHTCKDLTLHYRIVDVLKCIVCVQMNKQNNLNLVHTTLSMSTQKLKTVNSEEEKWN